MSVAGARAEPSSRRGRRSMAWIALCFFHISPEGLHPSEGTTMQHPLNAFPADKPSKKPEHIDDNYDEDDQAPTTPTDEPSPIPVRDPPPEETPHPPLTVSGEIAGAGAAFAL